jgi:integrase
MLLLCGEIALNLRTYPRAHFSRDRSLVEQCVQPIRINQSASNKLAREYRVRSLDLYSLRHTFASLGRTAGENAFNVSRAMGHKNSKLVDDVYAHSMQSGLASVA